MEIEQMTQKDLIEFREHHAHKNNLICPICKKKRNLGDFVVDHQHKSKSEINGENGAGMVRGVICFMCNSTEGRMLSKFKMSGLNRNVEFVDYLRSLADYLDQPTTQFIHPSEKPKEPKLMKRPFAKIAKAYSLEFPKKKPLEYPKTGKATKLIKELSEKYDIPLR